jgi:transposase
MIPMIHTHCTLKFHRTRSKSLRRHLNASKGFLSALLGTALSGGAHHSADFFWLGYFDHPFSSGMMEAIHNKIGTPTRMASSVRDGDCLHLRTTPSMSQKA